MSPESEQNEAQSPSITDLGSEDGLSSMGDTTLPETRPLTDPQPAPLPPLPLERRLADRHEPAIHFAQCCEQGVVRRRNEDSSFVLVSQTGGEEPLLPFALCLVADGMGGHHAGHEASRRVAHEVAQYVMSRIYLPLLRGEASDEPIRDVMLQAVESANRALYTPDPHKEGGTTLTAALIVGRRLYLVHVGDSRAYLLHDGHFILLTTDHSVVQQLQEAGHITAEEAETHPHRHLLYNAMTGHELEFDTFTRSLPKKGKLLLCSDGLWGSVSDEGMQATLEDESLTLQEQADQLIHQAIEGNSADNITALIVNFQL